MLIYYTLAAEWYKSTPVRQIGNTSGVTNNIVPLLIEQPLGHHMKNANLPIHTLNMERKQSLFMPGVISGNLRRMVASLNRYGTRRCQ